MNNDQHSQNVKWDELADWAESDAPLGDDYSDVITGPRAAQAGRKFLRGRPNLGHQHATGTGRSPKRATRLDEETDAALLARAKREGKSISEVMREVLRKELIDA